MHCCRRRAEKCLLRRRSRPAAPPPAGSVAVRKGDGGRAPDGGPAHGGTVPQVTRDVPLRLAEAGRAQRIKR
jgi:hypothetical protein